MNYYGLAIPASILVTLVGIAFWTRGGSGVKEGLAETGTLLRTVVPNLVIGFLLAGFLTLLLPRDAVAKWLGEESGWKGLIVGTAAGALTPGGPFTHFPILASLMGKGAGIGPVCAYLSAWALLGVHRIIIWEAPILGWRFVAVRVASCLVLPPIAGLAAQFIAGSARFGVR